LSLAIDGSVLRPAEGRRRLGGVEQRNPVTLRPAVAADYEAFAQLFPQLGTGDPLPPRDRFVHELARTTILAEHQGRAVGYAWFEALAGSGYVRHVVVDASSRGLGIGRALMVGVRDRLSAAGCAAWCLNVHPDNVPARRLYESLGLVAAYESAAVRFTWPMVEALPRGEALDVTVDPEAARDAEIEAAFGLVPGLLAGARAHGSRVIAVARRGDAIAGAAVFDPGFPGAFPFRLREAVDARRLLEGLRPFARSGVSEMGVVVEDHPALEALLVAAGAEVRFRMSHHRGSL
jgi:ribosomal protein S18 acetylase RimI-like enzyme